MTAEIPYPVIQLHLHHPASMRPRSNDRGNVTGNGQLTIYQGASMRPRSNDRGNDKRVVGIYTSRTGFNEAAI